MAIVNYFEMYGPDLVQRLFLVEVPLLLKSNAAILVSRCLVSLKMVVRCFAVRGEIEAGQQKTHEANMQ